MKPAFFAGPDDFRAWLEENAGTARELSVGFHRKATGRPSITWPEAVAEALSFGWIDGVRRSSGGKRGSTRPRSGASEPTSAWTFFQAQAPSYRRAAVRWVVSAGRAETSERGPGV